ncbi:MAG: CTP synthetase [Gammaproteobacteria bacterium]|nr:CTP synthetase [Gammaproteobacteria bacterium]
MKDTRFIFVTGGVVSSLGKGIASASIGSILESKGYKVSVIKLDPYFNVDPGTMSPFQHGEVFVLEDGTETDLDLGHYERFIDNTCTKKNNFTAGKIYYSVLKKERKGEYLGKTVQIIPHITDEIKRRIIEASSNCDIAIVEIGGTVGDIESQSFIEAIRQLGLELKGFQTAYLHLTLVPYLSNAGELKTKPTQHSVKEYRSLGVQPDILICRSEFELTEGSKDKIGLFCSMPKGTVISLPNLDTIYQAPVFLANEGLDSILTTKLQLEKNSPNLKEWKKVVKRKLHPSKEVKVSFVGKYVDLKDAYFSLIEALDHAGIHNDTKVLISFVNSEELDAKNYKKNLKDSDAILVPGGFGDRGIEGMVLAARYARETKIPYFGICLGLQIAIIEMARNLLKLKDANSTEFNKKTKNNVISLVTEWKNEDGSVEKRDQKSDKGGTMRLGAQKASLKKGTLAKKLYKNSSIFERHRHRYEVNPEFIPSLEEKGLIISARSEMHNLVEMIELKEHPWFVACQFHPEFTSKPKNGHPLFNDFVNTAVKLKGKK